MITIGLGFLVILQFVAAFQLATPGAVPARIQPYAVGYILGTSVKVIALLTWWGKSLYINTRSQIAYYNEAFTLISVIALIVLMIAHNPWFGIAVTIQGLLWIRFKRREIRG